MTVAVLMSTYNGEKYLEEQIESILKQTGVDIDLYIRDDGSKDLTHAIISTYEKKNLKIHFINRDKVENIGIRDSYFSLLDYGYINSSAEYFAFADQDDLWLPEKVAKAVYLLEETRMNPKGKLYFSNKTFVDEKLDEISRESIPYYEDYLEVLWKNRASGCTMVFDRALAGLLLKKWPATNCIHDGRIYRVAKSIGTTIVFDSNSYILYRQHESNSVGMNGTYQYHNSILYWIKRFIPMLFKKRKHNLIHFMEEIKNDYKDELSEDAKKILNVFLKYRGNIKSKIILIMDKRMKKRPSTDRIIWAYRVLFNWIP